MEAGERKERKWEMWKHQWEAKKEEVNRKDCGCSYNLFLFFFFSSKIAVKEKIKWKKERTIKTVPLLEQDKNTVVYMASNKNRRAIHLNGRKDGAYHVFKMISLILASERNCINSPRSWCTWLPLAALHVHSLTGCRLTTYSWKELDILWSLKTWLLGPNHLPHRSSEACWITLLSGFILQM